MSRFWGAGSDSESEEEEKGFFSKRAASDDDDEEREDDNEANEDKSGDEGSGDDAPTFWDRPDSDDEDENEEKRIVVSRQVKRNEALLNSIKAIKNAIKINDWGVIQEEFDNLVKIVQKPTSGLDKVVIPRGFIRCVVHIEDAFEFSWENKDKKKMSAANLKGLNSMKQKIRKVRQQYENEIGSFRSNPIDTDQSEEEKKGQQEPAEAEVEEEPAEEELAPEDVDKKVAEILGTRGKKNINRKKQIELLNNLFKIAEEPSSHARVLLALIALRFDQVTGLTTHLDVPTWKIAQGEFVRLLELLEKNENLIVTTEIEEGAEEIPESQQRPAVKGKKLIPGSLVAIVERLDDEFLKSLQNIDAHTTEYIDRLRDEPDLYEAIVRTQHYYTRTSGVEKDNDSISRTLIRRVEHIYFKPDNINNSLEKKVADRLRKGGAVGEINSNTLIQELCSTLYKSGNEVIRTRALLCHVFHHALHGRYFKARDLLLMSHLQETIQNADISTKILFNRAMVQTGLCAFRHGMLKESQNALQDIHSTGRAKELLAQGIVSQKGVEKTAEQERLEKHRQIPFHMHVNLELLECAFFTCSMILEVPFMASGNHEARKRVVSKPFRRLLDISEKQIFTGPPENTREHIMQAAKALMSGEWEKSTKLIEAIKIWDLMPQAAEIKAMLATKIQLSGLQTFLLTYSNFYETLSLDKLSQMFKLSKAEVHGAVSKMIVNEELYASLDQVTGVVVIHRVEPTKLQFLSLQFTEKAQSLIELNEKILEVRTGNLGGRDEKQQGQQGQQQGRGGYKQYNGNQRNFKQNNPTGGQRQFNPNYRFQKGPRPRYQNTGSRDYSGNQRDRDPSNQYQRGDRENQYSGGGQYQRENQYQREGQSAGN